jgi:hypothetical protein
MKNHYHLITLLITLSTSLTAQNFTGGFNFYLPPDDTAQSAYLPSFPAKALTDQDFVSINTEGHFLVRDNPIRFFGTNIGFFGAFPSKANAWYVAGRHRKMGFNIVRLQGLDGNPWAWESLFERGSDTRHLNLVNLDKLEYLIAEFKKNGTYINMGLNYCRTYTAQDGVADYDSFPSSFSTLVNYIDPYILFLNKEYAKQLLTHVNPYTGKPLCNDPVMALLEITNENSLYYGWNLNYLKTLGEGGKLPFRYVRMLDSLWVEYLKLKYPSTASLQSAWNIGSDTNQIINRLGNSRFETPVSSDWNFDNWGTGSATMEYDSINVYQGKYSGKAIVSEADGTNWHISLDQVGLSLTKDSAYQITFAARADSIRPITVSVNKSSSPYTGYGYFNTTLTTQWKTFSFSFKPSETIVNNVSFSFGIGSTKGTYWFDNVCFSGIKTQGLLAGESFESNTIRRIDYSECPGFTTQRVKDISAFYLQLEEKYFSAMKSFLKDTLGVKVPIEGTNWPHGAADCAGISISDFMDHHAYWDHPQFPTVPWSNIDWHIENTAMVKTDGGTIPGLMGGTAMLNKPYIISEYNHVFPNRYQVEGHLFVTSYASFQDVDGLMFFNYNSSSLDDWETDKTATYFDLHRNTAMMSLIPSYAIAYRKEMIKKYQQLVTVQYHPDTYLRIPKINFSQTWEVFSLYSPKISLEHGFRTASYHADSTTDFSSLPADPVNPYISDTKELAWDTSGLFTVSAPGFNAATGFFNSFPNHSFGAMTLVSGDDFGTLTWVALDTDSLLSARKSLLTVSSRIENTNMVWDGITTVHNNWGQAPTLMQPLTIKMKLNINADSIVVRPLDTYGNPVSSSKKYYPPSPNIFTVTIDQNKDKTVWFGIDAYGTGGSFVSVAGQRLARGYPLSRNYPNPFKTSTTISFDLPENTFVSLKVFNLFGREVATIASEELSTGRHTRQWNATNMQEGIYFYRLQAGPFTETKKLILLK